MHAASHSVLQRFLRAASVAHKKLRWNAISLDQAKTPLNVPKPENHGAFVKKVRAASF